MKNKKQTFMIRITPKMLKELRLITRLNGTTYLEVVEKYIETGIINDKITAKELTSM
jgi:hypothetical protein